MLVDVEKKINVFYTSYYREKIHASCMFTYRITGYFFYGMLVFEKFCDEVYNAKKINLKKILQILRIKFPCVGPLFKQSVLTLHCVILVPCAGQHGPFKIFDVY